ncbi:hypothetical protein DUNSADRAFT_1324 [Dunaliella salina]|uniref:Uncharacterized protein n=1 Tax=Dunaliella salina TaxID=3046 RepID=A0ABQ7FXL3_DUNSA|nr:hypothetical protein DUNSADRAFT_1324 [Dunaliella salina]|eukprot:KAF5827099.1 hypothetical protein DUNSADRAFT_1324 [Dunaliella salina]
MGVRANSLAAVLPFTDTVMDAVGQLLRSCRKAASSRSPMGSVTVADPLFLAYKSAPVLDASKGTGVAADTSASSLVARKPALFIPTVIMLMGGGQDRSALEAKPCTGAAVTCACGVAWWVVCPAARGNRS